MNDSYLFGHFDLVTPDGLITYIEPSSESVYRAEVLIENINDHFIGYSIAKEDLLFNLKSALAQLGLHSIVLALDLNRRQRKALIELELHGYGELAVMLLKLMEKGSYIGKLFAVDKERRVRNESYLTRMFGRTNYSGEPLLSFGTTIGYDHLVLERVEDRVVAFLPIETGVVKYSPMMRQMMPSFAMALKNPNFRLRDWVSLHQVISTEDRPIVKEGDILLVKTAPLHICTAFARVVDELLPQGYQHTSASVLQPDTKASGDIYELFGSSDKEIVDIPLEFYTLHPYKEHVFFSDRDGLRACIENPKCLFDAFKTMPKEKENRCSVFIVKSSQLLKLKETDWASSTVQKEEFPDDVFSTRRAALINRYIEQQSAYPFLKAIQDNEITSQGILLSRYFPTPLLKRFLISDPVIRTLKGIYFQIPSFETGNFFSHEDRALLSDLSRHCIPVFWVDEVTGLLLQYVHKPNKDSGMFVPVDRVQEFLHATVLGVYGSNLLEGDYQAELTELLRLLKEKKSKFNHPLMNEKTPLALITGGGPGAMSIGNQVAKNLGLLSCANIVDFSASSTKGNYHEQDENPYIQAKMTYSLDKLVERQAEFHLDLPIFVLGGMGTDFELALEEVRRKVGSCSTNPVLLFGKEEYWRDKITSRYQVNKRSGTIKGSEWVSNCFINVSNAKEGFEVYKLFFQGDLPIGHSHPGFEAGFATYKQILKVIKG
jgi:predicted Rossmann-fold nucleotide-binding protein